ncbi:MAG TPA: hypothetical protein VH877_34110 [Polyangia bacterium]|nr:hypothetical protein [Polyangia bacterium]
MRTWNHLLWPCVASLALVAAGCKGGSGGTDGGVDLVSSPDQTTPRPSGGPLAFTEITGQSGPVTGVRLISPVLSFRDASTPNRPSDFSNTNSLGIGCSADHFSVAGNDLPAPTANAGRVRITGFQAVTPAGSTTTYNAVDCQLNTTSGSYDCTYANTAGGTAGPPTSTPLGATDDPIQTGAAITFAGQGGGSFGTFSINSSAADTVSTATAATYTANQDTTITVTCPGSGCTGVVAANIDLSPANGTATAGHITCTYLSPSGGTLLIPQAAVNAALGCSSTGTNCDTTLATARTVIVRFPFPTGSGQDSSGNQISNVVAGQGVFSVGAIR